MKALFTGYSHYNKKTNDIILSYLEKLTENQLNQEIKAYYKSIGETLFHVMNSDIKWLTRLSSFHDSQITHEVLAPFLINEKLDPKLFYQNFKKFSELRSRIDKAIIHLIQAMPEKAFESDYEMLFGPSNITKKLWKLLLQWFNHHTHHRGQISIHLDLLGIDHDYSLMLNKIDI